MDWSILHSLNDFMWRNRDVEHPLLVYVNLTEVLFVAMLLLVIVCAYGERWASWRRAAVAAGLSAGLALAIGAVISAIVERARPFVTHPAAIHLFERHSADGSFPSDHATAAFAIGVAIVLRKRWWGVVVLIAAAVLSVGRVALGFHYPSDVIAGAIVGTVAALVLWIPPIRRLIEAISDWTGALWDRVLAWFACRLRLTRTARRG